jgi:hypothetical protein
MIHQHWRELDGAGQVATGHESLELINEVLGKLDRRCGYHKPPSSLGPAAGEPAFSARSCRNRCSRSGVSGGSASDWMRTGGVACRGHPMANNNPFDAALRAHVFHRSFPGGEEPGNRSGESPRDEIPAALPSPDFAAELETALARELNAAAAGLRPLPKKLRPDRPSSAPSAAAAEEAKSVSLTAALQQLRPATLPTSFETVKVSSRAPPRKPTSAPRPVAATSGEAGSLAASPEQQAGTRAMPAGDASKMPDDAAESRATPRHDDAARSPVSFGDDQFDDDKTAESEGLEGPSAAELAKRYAPQPSRAASTAQEARSVPEARANDAGKVRPIRRQAGDGTPAASFLRPPRGVNRTRTAAAVAIVLAGVTGGVGAVVSLESLAAPQPAPGVVAADPVHPTNGSDDERSAAAMSPSGGKMTGATRLPASGVEVVLAEDASLGVARAERAPLPNSAKVIPLPQPIATGVDLLHTRDAGNRGDTDSAAMDSAGAGAAPPVNAAPSGVAVEEPVADPVDVTAGLGPGRASGPARLFIGPGRASGPARLFDGSDSPAAPPPAPTPRPDHGGSPEGMLAYAPAADLVDRRAKVVAGKANDKPAAKGPKPGPARVVSWVSWVNVHASADNKAPAVTALPAGSMVTIVKCTSWCEIVADGKRGFVRKSFLTTIGADRLRDRGGSAFGNPYLKNLS